MNMAHTGKNLGLALYMALDHLDIVHKVCDDQLSDGFTEANFIFKAGWVTCDNTLNNGSMMDEFAYHFFNKTGRKYDSIGRCIRYVPSSVSSPTDKHDVLFFSFVAFADV